MSCAAKRLLGSVSATAFVLAVLLFSTTASRGIGFLLPNQDAAAIARGNAFAATADNPSAIYYDPAGISQLPGFNCEIGLLSYLGIDSFYSPSAGAGAESKFQYSPVPEIYLTYSPTNLPLSFGLGVYAPFGLGVEWPSDSGLRTVAINSKLTYLTINPVVSWQILKSLSVAVGPTINYANIKFNRGLFDANDFYEFKGSGYSYGLTAGILWHPLEKWSFGADYRLAATSDFKGSSRYNNPAPMPASGTVNTTASIPFPQTASVGISFRPTPVWNLEADLDYINWSPLQSITLAGTQNLFGQNLVLPLHWRDSWQYKFGVTRYFEDGWFASAGYYYTTETSPSTYFTPAVPDTALNVGSVGFGRNGRNWNWALVAQIIAGSSRTITPTAGNTDPFTMVSAAGQQPASSSSKFRLFSPTLTLSVDYHF